MPIAGVGDYVGRAFQPDEPAPSGWKAPTYLQT